MRTNHGADVPPPAPGAPTPTLMSETTTSVACETCGVPATDPYWWPYCGPECVAATASSPPPAPGAPTPTLREAVEAYIAAWDAKELADCQEPEPYPPLVQQRGREKARALSALRTALADAALTAAITRSLAAATERAERDAERYRWLRGQMRLEDRHEDGYWLALDEIEANHFIGQRIGGAPHDVDEAIDAARAVEGRET